MSCQIKARAGGTYTTAPVTAAPVAAAPVATENGPVGATLTHTVSPVATSYKEATTVALATMAKGTQIT